MPPAYAFCLVEGFVLTSACPRQLLPSLHCSLTAMSNDSNSPIELLTIAEVAEQLKISISGVRRLQHARRLPFVKVGGSVRFFQSDVVAFLRKRRLDAVE